MRKLFILLLLCVTVTVWAQDKPKSGGAGFGVFFANDFNGHIDMTASSTDLSLPMSIRNVGIYAYGDFVYVELICAMFFGFDKNFYFSFLGADLGLYGKYSFRISKWISIFPLLGFEYQSALFAVFNAMRFTEGHIDWKQFWFKGGIGFDYHMSEKLYLRFEALYGIRPKSGAKNDQEDGTWLVINDNVGHSITFRIALGI